MLLGYDLIKFKIASLCAQIHHMLIQRFIMIQNVNPGLNNQIWIDHFHRRHHVSMNFHALCSQRIFECRISKSHLCMCFHRLIVTGLGTHIKFWNFFVARITHMQQNKTHVCDDPGPKNIRTRCPHAPQSIHPDHYWPISQELVQVYHNSHK
jgi:hypothetical protein